MLEKLKSVSAYIVLALVVGIFVYLISSYASEINNSPHSELSNGSKAYISEITGSQPLGFNTSIYNTSTGYATNLSGNDNKNEFSLDFNYGEKGASKIERVIYIATNIPEFLLMDVFRLTSLKWFADLLDWAVRIFLFIAIVIFVRKGDN